MQTGYLWAMRFPVLAFLFFWGQVSIAQQGAISGIVTDENTRPLEKATLRLQSVSNAAYEQAITSTTDGTFAFSSLPYGLYQLQITYIGLQPLLIDSLLIREERYIISLGELRLKPKNTSGLNEIVIYAEKPLIQSKDGNITFNAGESALSQGSNASDLLTQVPLVTKDPDGKLLVKGKEPRILIDDKPVELNLQQLQDLLESLPGSSIEKIEVMTNPPPQYANEPGGVINIITRKGTVGLNGRLSFFAGTRGEAGTTGSFSYRRSGLSVNVNAGFVDNDFQGNGYTLRKNIYPDSLNFFNNRNRYNNTSYRPNVRASVDYEISKAHSVNLVVQFNGNRWDNNSKTEFENINRFGNLYRASTRRNESKGANSNPDINLNYTWKSNRPGEMLRVFSGFWRSGTATDRLFYQQFLNNDYSFSGNDSTQQQVNHTFSNGYHLRLSYDRPLGKKTFLSAGGVYNRTLSDVNVEALYRQKSDGALRPLDLLSNDFLFWQDVANFRLSVKQMLAKSFSITAGMAEEKTTIQFDLRKAGKDTGNAYWTLLPFVNLNKNWENNLSLTVSYRKSIRRPGINELNPTRDFSDPYNIRAGNPGLLPSTAHNFNVVAGRHKNALYTNLSLGYNVVNDIFNPIRTLLGDGTTEIIWQNISGKKEYELSTWSGYTFARKLRTNISASYVFNQYGAYDKRVRRYRDAASLTSNVNANYTLKELYTFSGNFTYNRFANPQGIARSTMSMNLGVQARLLAKKLTLTANFIDPFFQQQNRNFTFGPNFEVESFYTTRTRNYRLAVGYHFSKTRTKRSQATEKAVQHLLNKS